MVVSFAQPSYLVVGVRVTTAVFGYEEIDAVGLNSSLDPPSITNVEVDSTAGHVLIFGHSFGPPAPQVDLIGLPLGVVS